MFSKIISFSVKNRPVVLLGVLAIIVWGSYSMVSLPIDAVPDITNNQVQIITRAPALATQEVEYFITAPLEQLFANLQGVEDFRSISRFGLSVITVVFEDQIDVMKCRQLVSEQLVKANEFIPAGAEIPELAPISTGLGEIYQYIIRPQKGYEQKYSIDELRTIQDWMVRRQLSGIAGVVEVNSFGGKVKQYQIKPKVHALRSYQLTTEDIFKAVTAANFNSGGGYLERDGMTFFLRGEGKLENAKDLESVVVKYTHGIPLLLSDVAEVSIGHQIRYGAMTSNGKGEVVGGIVMMLKGSNSNQVINRIKQRIEVINTSLPEGLEIHAFLDRSILVNKTIKTVAVNLLEGGIIVILVLVLFMGNWRAGLITASVIPLSMLFAFGCMEVFGVSANLMSLGAIDFGLVVDGSVIVIEAILFKMSFLTPNKPNGAINFENEVTTAATNIRKSAAFGEIIILIVYLPILTLSGIEGKMFKPMAQTVSFAILGAMILSFTYIPMMASWLLRSQAPGQHSRFSENLMQKLKSKYQKILGIALRYRISIVSSTLLAFAISVWMLTKLGAEFIPSLDEGDFALEVRLKTGTALSETIKTSTQVEKILAEFPEVKEVVSKIGTSQIPTDPMPVEANDLMVVLHPPSQWTTAETKDALADSMKQALGVLPGVLFEFLQPIEMRFNELMTGVKSDVAVKIYGDNLTTLQELSEEVAMHLTTIQGIADIKPEEIEGLPQINIKPNRKLLAKYGFSVDQIHQVIEASVAGKLSGQILEEEKRFDIVIRFFEASEATLDALRLLPVGIRNGRTFTLAELCHISYVDAPVQISRDNARRRVVVGFNVRGRDVASVIDELKTKLNSKLKLPTGYYFTFGGQYENLRKALDRLQIVVPLALFTIFMLLYFTFNSWRLATIIFLAIPMATIGGVFALWLRDMPFSISAGIGFIALFGVAVLNGIVLVSHFEELKRTEQWDYLLLIRGALDRLRPVLMTATVASLGFLPMALSNSAGAEVQKPLATVVIGGLLTSTFLTLIVLPVLYSFFSRLKIPILLVLAVWFLPHQSGAQSTTSLEEAIQVAKEQNTILNARAKDIESAYTLRKSAYLLPKAQIDALYGQLQEVRNDYTFTAVQEFSPFLISALRKSATVRVSQSESFYNQALLRLVTEIRMLYNKYTYLENQLILNAKLDSLFGRLVKSTQYEFEIGSKPVLDAIAAKTQKKLLEQKSRNLVKDKEILRAQLKYLTGVQQELFPQKLNELQLEAEEYQEHPQLTLARLEVEGLKKKAGIERAYLFPDVRLGYINQSVEGIRGLQAAQAGFSIPIAAKGYHLRYKASKIEIEAQSLQYEAFMNEWNTLKLKAELNYDRLKEESLFYTLQALPESDQIWKSALELFDKGQIDFHQLVMVLRQAIEIQEQYLEKQFQLNQSVIDRWYLNGKI